MKLLLRVSFCDVSLLTSGGTLSDAGQQKSCGSAYLHKALTNDTMAETHLPEPKWSHMCSSRSLWCSASSLVPSYDPHCTAATPGMHVYISCVLLWVLWSGLHGSRGLLQFCVKQDYTKPESVFLRWELNPNLSSYASLHNSPHNTLKVHSDFLDDNKQSQKARGNCLAEV